MKNDDWTAWLGFGGMVLGVMIGFDAGGVGGAILGLFLGPIAAMMPIVLIFEFGHVILLFVILGGIIALVVSTWVMR
ncbi:MAG: hypothetical protein WCO04_17790 [Pseudomonadota bacterium]